MTKVYVLCHGDWATPLLEVAKKHFGLNLEYKVFSLNDDDKFEMYQERIEESIKSETSKILMICDLTAGSTSHAALALGYKYDLEAVSGLSLQTLLLVDKELSQKDTVDGIGKIIEKKNENLCVDLMECMRKFKGGK